MAVYGKFLLGVVKSVFTNKYVLVVFFKKFEVLLLDIFGSRDLFSVFLDHEFPELSSDLLHLPELEEVVVLLSELLNEEIDFPVFVFVPEGVLLLDPGLVIESALVVHLRFPDDVHRLLLKLVGLRQSFLRLLLFVLLQNLQLLHSELVKRVLHLKRLVDLLHQSGRPVLIREGKLEFQLQGLGLIELSLQVLE